MDSEITQSAETCVLELDGKWTIERASELKNLLLEALKGHDRVLLALDGLEEIDLSCLQLLCSAHRSFLKLDKRLEAREGKPEIFDRVVRDAGFTGALAFLHPI